MCFTILIKIIKINNNTTIVHVSGIMLYHVLNALSNKSVFSLDLKTNGGATGANYRKDTVPPRP